jgi:hypothetical protein
MTADQFLADVAKHKLTVKLDEGLYRHLVFRQPENSNMWFGIVTWPGYLTVCGDMGTWTFSRLEDMFTFFRNDKLRINESYWAEKLQHGMFVGRDGARVFDDDLFRGQLLSQLTEYYSLPPEQLLGVTEALRNEVLSQDGKYDLLIAARDFKHGSFQFDTCELPDGKEYSFHFVWCLYAIVWAIQQYDALLQSANRSNPNPLTETEKSANG